MAVQFLSFDATRSTKERALVVLGENARGPREESDDDWLRNGFRGIGWERGCAAYNCGYGRIFVVCMCMCCVYVFINGEKRAEKRRKSGIGGMILFRAYVDERGNPADQGCEVEWEKHLTSAAMRTSCEGAQQHISMQSPATRSDCAVALPRSHSSTRACAAAAQKKLV